VWFKEREAGMHIALLPNHFAETPIVFSLLLG